MGLTGHYNSFLDAYNCLEQVLGDSSFEMYSVATRLVQVSHDFNATESQIAAELKRQEQQVISDQPKYP